MNRKTIYITAVMLLALSAAAYASGDVWQDFVANPNESGYRACIKEIVLAQNPPLTGGLLSGDPPRMAVLPDKDTVKAIADLIEAGNMYAFHLGFHAYPVLKEDKNNAKRLDIALGKLFKRKPDYFVMIYENYRSQSEGYEFGPLVATLDDAILVDPDMGIAEIDQRIDALKAVKDKNMKHLVDEGTASLYSNNGGDTTSQPGHAASN